MAVVGKPFHTKYYHLFLVTQTAQGKYALHGVYLPRALCQPVVGLRMSVWGVTDTPHFHTRNFSDGG